MKIDFKGALGTIAPMIAQAVGASIPIFGPMAASMIGSALGVKDVEPTASGVSAAIEKAGDADPEVLLKIQQVEKDFQLRMTALGIDSVEKLAALDVQDVEGARAREIAVRDRLPAILAMTVTGGFFGLLWMLSFREIPATSHDLLLTLIGSLGGAWLSIVGYYFGSSHGSDKQKDIIAAQVAKTK